MVQDYRLIDSDLFIAKLSHFFILVMKIKKTSLFEHLITAERSLLVKKENINEN